jgi:uncharacterized repeat protein (TIGR03803 family)
LLFVQIKIKKSMRFHFRKLVFLMPFAISLSLSLPVRSQTFKTLFTFGGSNGPPDSLEPGVGLTIYENNIYGTTVGGIYRLNIDGSGYTNLHGTGGSNPQGQLTISGNTIYGTTGEEGSSFGTVFRVNTDGTAFTNLHSFVLGVNGESSPLGGVVLSGNTLYGTTPGNLPDLPNSSGTIFAINIDGTGFTNLHVFGQTDGAYFNDDGSYPVAGLVLSGDTLFGSTKFGGEGVGTLFAMKTDGSEYTNLFTPTGFGSENSFTLSGNTLYGTDNRYPADVFSIGIETNSYRYIYSFSTLSGIGGPYGTNSDGEYPNSSLVLLGNTLYGTTSAGGTSGYGTIFSVNTDGTHFVNIHDFTNGSDGASPGSLVCSGNTLYGTTGLGVSTIFSIYVEPSAKVNVNTTNGLAPLTIQFTSSSTDDTGIPLVSWNWDFGDGSTSGERNPVHIYKTTGIFATRLAAINNLGINVAGISPLIDTEVSSNLVLNGDFETGSYSNWTLSNAGYSVVDDGSLGGKPYSGNYSAFLGTTTSPGYLYQTLATKAGSTYLISFWLNDFDFGPRAFSVVWDGNITFNQTYPATYAWTNVQFEVTATSSNTLLQFGIEQGSYPFYLDNISVVSIHPNIVGISLSGTNLIVNGANGFSGASYYVLNSTNLALPLSQWARVATNTLNTSGAFTIVLTNPMSPLTPKQYYDLQLR